MKLSVIKSMKSRIKPLFYVTLLLFVLYVPVQARAQHRAVLKTGWMFMVKPFHRYLFDAQLVDRYRFAGPFSFEFGGGFSVNTTSMGTDFLLGGALEFPQGKWRITFRAAFITKWLFCYETEDSDAVLTSSFGPGFTYKFKNGRSIGFDLAFELGEVITGSKRFYFGVVPGLIFIF